MASLVLGQLDGLQIFFWLESQSTAFIRDGELILASERDKRDCLTLISVILRLQDIVIEAQIAYSVIISRMMHGSALLVSLKATSSIKLAKSLVMDEKD